MLLNSLIPQAIERRWLTIICSVIVMMPFFAGMPHLKSVDVDFRNHFAEDDIRLIELEELEDTFAISDSVLIAVAPKSGNIFSRESLAVVDELTEELWRTPYSTRVDSLTNYSHSEGTEDDLIVAPLVEDTQTLSDADIERIMNIALNTEEVAGRLVAPDGRVAGLTVSFVVPEDNRQAAKIEIVDFLNATAADARANHADIEYHLTGELLLNRTVRDTLDQEFSILGPTAIGIILLVAVLMLRSILGMLAIVLVLIAVIPSTLGFAGWTGMKFYGESGASVFVLMAVTCAHCVHIIEGTLGGLRQGMTRNQAILSSMRTNTWPVFLTSLTTAIGFLSLNFSDMPPFRVMGNIVAFGALAAFVFSVTLLPALLSVLPLRVRLRSAEKSTFFERFGQFVVSRHLLLLGVSSIVIIGLLAGISRIELDTNHLQLLDESFELRRANDFVTANLTGLEPFEYALDSGENGGITNVGYLQQVEAFANWYRAQPEVGHVFAITDVIKRLNKNLNGDDPEFYSIPDNSDLVAQYLLLYEFSLPIGLDLNNLIDVERSATRMTVILTNISANEKIQLDQRARAWLRQNAPDMEVGATGVPIVGSYSIKRNIDKMLLGTVIAMGVVSFLLIFVFKSLWYGLISLIPNFFPAAIAIGLWGYLIGEIGVAAAVVTAIAFGIIVDDTIHFLTKYLKGRRSGLPPAESIKSTFSTVGKALLVTSLMFALGFMVFGTSGISDNQALGLLMVITVFVALLADFLFLPPLLMVLDRVRNR